MADNTIATAYVQLVASADGLQKNISEELGAAGTSGANSFSSSFSSIIGKVSGAIAGAAATGVTAITSQAVRNYSEYEQLVGGVETLFGESADVVQEYANNAYRTAGLSANAYMETVTSFAASLIQALDGDTATAAGKAELAIKDMSDNANKMGTSMESIQNAYQGFAKQNYTMLDNLKLGYGGTKEEMNRLLADASEIAGIEYDISSYADVVDAIHVIQENLGITGTTAIEASGTITGSLSSVKAAWQNVLTGVADETADFDGQIETFSSTLTAFANNMIPRIATALSGVGKLITSIAPIIIEQLPPMLTEMLPIFITAFSTLITSVADVLPSLLTTVITAIGSALPTVASTVVKSIAKLLTSVGQALPTIIPGLVSAIIETIIAVIDNLPLILDAALALISGLADGIIAALPVLIEALPAIIEGIVFFFMDSITAIMDAAVILLMALVDAIPLIVTTLTEKMPDIITAIILAIQDAGPDLFVTSVELLSQLLAAIPEIIALLWAAMPDVIDAIVQSCKDNWDKLVENGKESAGEMLKGFVDSSVFAEIGSKVREIVDKFKESFGSHFDTYKELGKNIIQGLIDGIKNMAGNIGDTVNDVANSIAQGFKDFFGIASPSKLFYAYGEFIDEGLVNGIDAGQDEVTNAMSSLNNSIVTDFNDGAIVGGYHGTYAGSSSNTSNLADLLATYLPIIAEGRNMNVTLEGDADALFSVIRKSNADYMMQTGHSAFA